MRQLRVGANLMRTDQARKIFATFEMWIFRKQITITYFNLEKYVPSLSFVCFMILNDDIETI